jgi:hypothetical protein
MTVRLALLRAVDAAQADAFRVSVVEDFEGIAVEDPDDEAMILRDSDSRSGCQEGEEHTERPYGEATVETKSEGHGSLARKRIVGASQHTWQRSMRDCPSGSCRGFYGVLGQWGIHLAHPLIDLEGERVPPPTERQGYDTIILS